MYKEVLICIIVVVFIVSLNWFLQDYTKSSISTISNKLNELKDDLKSSNKKDAEEKMNSIHGEWEQKFKILAIFIEHDELEKVETNLVALRSYIEVEDFNMGINELERGTFVLKHIAEKYDFSLVNVF